MNRHAHAHKIMLEPVSSLIPLVQSAMLTLRTAYRCCIWQLYDQGFITRVRAFSDLQRAQYLLVRRNLAVAAYGSLLPRLAHIEGNCELR